MILLITMISRDVLERTISELERTADTIESTTKQLLLNTSIIHERSEPFDYYYWESQPDESLQRRALRDYQRWYVAAHQLVNEFLPEKEDEFAKSYDGGDPEGVLGFIQLTCYTSQGNKQKIR